MINHTQEFMKKLEAFLQTSDSKSYKKIDEALKSVKVGGIKY